MRVRVKFFAAYRDIVGESVVTWSGSAGATLGDLLNDLLQRHPSLESHRETMLLAVNQEFAKPSARLRDGDVVAIMPPVSGGLR